MRKALQQIACAPRHKVPDPTKVDFVDALSLIYAPAITFKHSPFGVVRERRDYRHIVASTGQVFAQSGREGGHCRLFRHVISAKNKNVHKCGPERPTCVAVKPARQRVSARAPLSLVRFRSTST